MSIKEKIFELGNKVIIGIIFLALIIFYAGLKTGNIYFIVFGLFVLLLFGIFYLFEKLKLKRQNKKALLEFEKFKMTAIQVKVNLLDLEIKSNSWTDRIVVDESRYAGLNQLTGNPNRNVELVERNINNVKIEIPYNGEIIEYNFNVSMDTTKLKMHFAIQKETILYVDKNDKGNHYLDIKFLI